MLIKYTLKNIFSKPGRLIILILCLTVACLAGFAALDYGSSVRDTFGKMYSKYRGDYLILYWGNEGVTDAIFEGYDISKIRFIGSKSVTKREITRKEKLYTFALTEEISISSYSDPDDARALKMLEMDYDPGEGEIAISKDYSEKYGYNIGDELILYDTKQNPVPLTVTYIYDKENYLGEMSGLICKEQAFKLTNSTIFKGGIVDIPDEDREEFERVMTEKHPNVLVTKVYITDEEMEGYNNVTYILYLVFVLVFVLVIFVTVSFTEKIITERMSVIGTLRSIGMSLRETTGILLFENVIYGLMGSGIALVLYLLLRNYAMTMLAVSVSGSTEIGDINILNCLIIVLFAILLQILVPMSAVMKAVRTSIRDIIFDSRDGEYRVSYPKTIIGAVMIAAGLICGFLFENLAVSIVSVLLIIMGAGLSIQFVVRKVTYAMSGVFGAANMPVAELAAVETGSKKPNSSNAVLAVAAVITAATVFLIGGSIMGSLERYEYNSDIIVTNVYDKTTKYEYLSEMDNVTDVEYVYETGDDISIKDRTTRFMVMALPDYRHYKVYGELPASLEADECAFDPIAMNKMGIKEGDTVEITFNSYGVFPIKKTMHVVRALEYSPFMGMGTIIVSHQLYNELYADTVTTIFITTDDPVNVKTDIEDSMTKGEKIRTMAEYVEDKEEYTAQVRIIIIAVVVVAISLTLIGISGNQIIGFASRKKEYAMLHSCACPRSSIIKMILTENALLFGVACIVSAVLCIPVTMLVARIFIMTDTGIFVSVHYGVLFLCIFALWAVTMLTSLSPIRSLRKMNTAMEMKYE
ncbi:MAG: ABC transporter permease [Ruminiclostridium sp.]|nr:ABC transporter permease [Ruminiclostridium sp.]